MSGTNHVEAILAGEDRHPGLELEYGALDFVGLAESDVGRIADYEVEILRRAISRSFDSD